MRRANESLATEAATAHADLGSLDTQLASTRSRLAKLRARGVVLAHKQTEARLQLKVARDGLRISQRRLADRVRALYEQGKPEPLAVILGAESIDQAVSGVDHLGRMADEDRSFIRGARSARTRMISVTKRLAQAEAENESLRASAAAAAATLIRARAQRLSRIAWLASQQRANGAHISSLESSARALASVAVPTAGGDTVLTATPSGGSRLLTVVATGYALNGHTASGIPVGPGVVAVDPSVIPLGTPLTIPGYGQGIAADTGGAIQGARIDLWFSSHAEALAWGRRTVTIAVGG